MLTSNEQQASEATRHKFEALCRYLAATPMPELEDVDGWFQLIAAFNRLQGNLSNDQSYMATLLAKRFLQTRFGDIHFDAAEKAQGASGLDIDIKAADGRRIIGEIKTTVPYAIGIRDLGAQQKTSFRKDFAKLNAARADHKFFFVTDRDTYQIVQKRYSAEIPGVEVILLSKE